MWKLYAVLSSPQYVFLVPTTAFWRDQTTLSWVSRQVGVRDVFVWRQKVLACCSSAHARSSWEHTHVINSDYQFCLPQLVGKVFACPCPSWGRHFPPTHAASKQSIILLACHEKGCDDGLEGVLIVIYELAIFTGCTSNWICEGVRCSLFL